MILGLLFPISSKVLCWFPATSPTNSSREYYPYTARIPHGHMTSTGLLLPIVPMALSRRRSHHL